MTPLRKLGLDISAQMEMLLVSFTVIITMICCTWVLARRLEVNRLTNERVLRVIERLELDSSLSTATETDIKLKLQDVENQLKLLKSESDDTLDALGARKKKLTEIK